jgi:hypothetical protein
MAAIREPSEEKSSVHDNPPVDTPSPKPIPDGGLVAWLQVAGSFCLYFCTWGIILKTQEICLSLLRTSHTNFHRPDSELWEFSSHLRE